jgi:hypothetical protein
LSTRRISESSSALDEAIWPCESLNPDREPAVHAVYLLIKGDDLLIEHADLSAECVKLRRDDVLEGLLDLVVDAHRRH